MKKIIYPVLLMFMFSCNQNNIQYPETRKSDAVDEYFAVGSGHPTGVP
jgi:hypothetical protein